MNYPVPYDRTWNIHDASKLNEYLECPRKYFYHYVLGWVSDKPNNDLVFGASWHKAMEYLLLNGYELRSVAEAADLFIGLYRKDFPEESDELFVPKTPSNAIEALSIYTNEYRNDHSEFEVLYTEISGTVPLAEDVIMHFRMDNILKKIKPEDGRSIFSLEHKTSGKGKSRQWEDQWILSEQIGTYTHVIHCLYPPEEVLGIKMNGAFFLKTKLDFARMPCYRNRESMQVWLWNTLLWIDAIRWNFDALSECNDSEDVLMAFPMNPQSCTKYWGCAFHDFCIAWPNPLRRCDHPPIGFKQEFWDPSAIETTHKMDLGKTIDSMMEELGAEKGGDNE